MAIQVINTKKRLPDSGKASAKMGSGSCLHTVKAEDLRIHKPVAHEEGLSMVLKLK